MKKSLKTLPLLLIPAIPCNKSPLHQLPLCQGQIIVPDLTAFRILPGSRSTADFKGRSYFLTPEWKGERFPDGRPKVPDNILKRMKDVSQEEAWAVMKNAGYGYQVAEGWQLINPDSTLVGRAVTATFMPARPDVWGAIDARGKKAGKKGQNTWPVDCWLKEMYMLRTSSEHTGTGLQSVTT